MKHSNPIQLLVLIIALLLGYNAMQTIPYFIWLFFRWFSEGLRLEDSFYNVVINFLFIAFYFISAVILVKRSKSISEKISETSHLSSDFSIAVNKTDLLYITIVAIGGYIILTRLPKLLVKMYLLIQDKSNAVIYDGPNIVLPGDSLPEFIIIIALSIILIAYAKPLAKYFSGPVEDEHAVDEIGTHPHKK